MLARSLLAISVYPRYRGERLAFRHVFHLGRFIPATAGNTPERAVKWLFGTGLSPLPRGTLLLSPS
ncbi:hypothetical protein HZX00_004804 [Salmonella enterica]|nr:hypothetical protein [Salmonella enterica]EGF6148430.1 hypothetical protein [Salmonella enterica]EHE6021522.1 hypothetical protein [Salmonella enterica]